MNYQDTLDYLVEQLPMYQKVGSSALRTGLDNALRLDDYFKSPHLNYPTIHVAGTNGKGSVSHMLASVLQEAGYKVGLYTSPHLLDFRERIKVNGKLIGRKFITDFIEENISFFRTFKPSFFEISVFMALNFFVRSRVDIAVIEVGLGGRLDATNIINPVLSVITNIGKDHTEILGDTMAKIAAEKAGIIKSRTPVVIGESHPDTLPVFIRRAEEVKAPVIVADRQYQIDSSYITSDGFQVFKVKKNAALPYPNLKCGLLGHYQRKNTATLLSAIDQLRHTGFNLEEKVIYTGIKNVIRNTGLAGRWQITGHEPAVIADTAHNPDGLKQVVQQIAETPHDKLHMIIGFVNDKDIDSMLQFLPQKADYYFTRLSVPRTMDEKVLESRALTFGIKGNSFQSVKDALDSVKDKTTPADLVIITGSNFLVADFLSLHEGIK